MGGKPRVPRYGIPGEEILDLVRFVRDNMGVSEDLVPVGLNDDKFKDEGHPLASSDFQAGQLEMALHEAAHWATLPEKIRNAREEDLLRTRRLTIILHDELNFLPKRDARELEVRAWAVDVRLGRTFGLFLDEEATVRSAANANKIDYRRVYLRIKTRECRKDALRAIEDMKKWMHRH